MRIMIDLPRKTKCISMTSIVENQNRYDVDAFTFMPRDGDDYELAINEKGKMEFKKVSGVV